MTMTDQIRALELDRYAKITTRAGRIFSGAIAEAPEDCICLLEATQTNTAGAYGQTFTTIRLDEIAAFTDFRDSDGAALFYILNDRSGAGDIMRADHAQDIYVKALAPPR